MTRSTGSQPPGVIDLSSPIYAHRRRPSRPIPGVQVVSPLPGVGPMRRYSISWLDAAGMVQERAHRGPDSPLLEDAVAALAQGTLIATQSGPTAVEDLTPGTKVLTADHGAETLIWIGSTTLTAHTQSGRDTASLVRVVSDAFGPDRPLPDLVLGPRARLLYRHAGCRDLLGADAAFAPARAFADGVNVVCVAPVSTVQVFHLGFVGQRTILANGLPVESYHPGPALDSMLAPEMVPEFMALFPHLSGPEQFGPMPVPRLTAFELEALRAA